MFHREYMGEPVFRPTEREVECAGCGYPLRYFQTPESERMIRDHTCVSCGCTQHIDTELNVTRISERDQGRVSMAEDQRIKNASDRMTHREHQLSRGRCPRCDMGLEEYSQIMGGDPLTECPRCGENIKQKEHKQEGIFDGDMAFELSKLDEQTKDKILRAEFYTEVRTSIPSTLDSHHDEEQLDKEMTHRLMGAMVDKLMQKDKVDIDKEQTFDGMAQSAKTYIFTNKEWQQILAAAFWSGFDYRKEQENEE